MLLNLIPGRTQGQCFQPATNYNVGSSPRSVAVSDVNADGLPDIITANFSSANVSVVLGQAGGGFGPTINYPTVYAPYSVAVSDVNGDNWPDIITSNQSNRVVVLIGQGNGSFGPPTNYSTGASPFSVAVNDMNGDGRLDIITANQGSASVSVLLGNGNGTFSAAITYPLAAGGYAVAVSDVNADGRSDIICANSSIANVSVLLGQVGGGFEPPANYSVGVNPQSVAIGDMNRDGLPDIITANVGSNNVSVLLRLGSGGFAARMNYPVGLNPQSVAVSDVNGDGRPDIITANVSSNTISVLPGLVGGGFGAPGNYPTGTSPYSVAVGEVNGDGRPDIITANANSNSISVLTSVSSIGITTQPVAATTVTTGATVTASVTANGPVPLSYQWYKNNLANPVADQTTETLTLTNVTLADAGSYSVVITDLCGSVTSTPFTLLITQPIRYVKAGATGDGSSWATASGDLQAMIDAEGVQQVWVAGGTYKPTTGTDQTISFVLKEGVAIYGGFVGNESQLSQRPAVNPVTGPGGASQPSSSTLSGDIGTPGDVGLYSDNSAHVIRSVGGLTASAVLDGFVITNGNAGAPFTDNFGGGLQNINSSPTIRNCYFVDNEGSGAGGGIYNQNGNLSITNCRFGDGGTTTNGTALANTGTCSVTIASSLFEGQITEAGGGIVQNYTGNIRLTITGSTFRDNTLSDFGCIYNVSGADVLLEMTDCVLQNNTSPGAGGINHQAAGSVVLTRCQFVGNSATQNDGGSIYFLDGASLMARDCSFTGNSASGDGGAIYLGGSSPLTLNLTGCVFSKNGSGGYAGGAISVDNSNASPTLVNTSFVSNTAINGRGGGLVLSTNSASLINCSFLDNQAAVVGGGIYNEGNLHVINGSFQNNQANQGGAIYTSNGSVQLTNSVLWNQGGANTFILGGGSLSASYSLFEPSVTGYTSGPGNLTTTTAPFAGTATTQLAAGSPAINAGNSLSYTAAGGPATDLGGNVRIQNGTIDMGAYELGLPTDLTPVVYARTFQTGGETTLSLVVDVFEVNIAPTTAPLTVRITKDAKVALSFDNGLSSVGGRSVQNSAWSFDATQPGYYQLSTSQPMTGGAVRSVGLTGRLSPGGTAGMISLSATVAGGGEDNLANNTDADKIEYFQQ